MGNIVELHSKFQKIVIEPDALQYGEHCLYLDDMWQYGSTVEYKYHETIATLPAVCCSNLGKALICGGGDGLAARELLKFPNLQVDLVEIDGKMIELYSTMSILTRLNVNSLNHERCNVVVDDAIKFARNSEEGTYDLIILDFPSPGEGNKPKDYEGLLTADNMAMFLSRLRMGGILISQTSMPIEDIVPCARLLLEKGWYMWNLDTFYNSKGSHDNFTICSKQQPQQHQRIPDSCRFITPDHVKYGLCEATEVTEVDLEHFRLFQYVEEIEYEYASADDIN